MLTFLKGPTHRFKLLFRKSSRWPIGYAIIAGVLLTRWVGLFANFELMTLDFLLRNRPPEGIDEEIVVVLFERNSQPIDVGIAPGNAIGPSQEQIANLLKLILSADPTVVGLNIFPHTAKDSLWQESLVDIFTTHDNVIGVEKALPLEIEPPNNVPQTVIEEQFGANDIPIDQDGRVRRIFMGLYAPSDEAISSENTFKFSFSMLLAEQYLARQGYSLENHPRNQDIPTFNGGDQDSFTSLPILTANSGGYFYETGIQKIQTLLNFRPGLETFQIVSASKLFNRSQTPDLFRDKIVIVGSIDADVPPSLLPNSASSNLLRLEPQQEDENSTLPRIGVVGSELEAHSVSQIINAVLHDRPLIWTLPVPVEDLLILFSGLAGIAVSISLRSSMRSAIALALSTVSLFIFCYLCLLSFGLWLPVAPMVVCLPLAGMIYLGFNYSSQRRAIQSQQAALGKVKVLEAERRKAIERAFSAIHAGPLQRLSSLIRSAKDGDIDREFVLEELRLLNKEIRGVGERLRQEAIGDVYFFYSEGNIKLDLTHPMHEVLYEVYSLSVKRQLPGFEKVRVRAVSIEPFNCKKLNLDIKRQLCWFLEESLQNIGKHAVGATRIQVSGKHKDEFYQLRIEDNGPGLLSTHAGDGTQIAYRLESVLHGKFSRFSKQGGGTVCELSWPSLMHQIASV